MKIKTQELLLLIFGLRFCLAVMTSY